MATTETRIYQKFGKNIKKIREKHGISPEKVARESGLSGRVICSVEEGKRNITIHKIVRIQKALGCNVDHLFEGI